MKKLDLYTSQVKAMTQETNLSLSVCSSVVQAPSNFSSPK